MKHSNKVLIGIALSFLVIGGIATWLISSKFDEAGLRQFAVATLRQDYQRDLTISGDLKLQFFPSIAIVAKGISISNPDKFPKGDFLQAESVKVNVAIFPLLTGNISVEEVKVDGATLNLLSTSDGRHNWDFQGGHEPTSNKVKNKVGNKLALNIDRIELVRGKLSYRDEQAALAYSSEISKFMMVQSGGQSNIDMTVIEKGITVQAKGQINPISELLDVALGQSNQNLTAQLKVLINQQPIELTGTWRYADSQGLKDELPAIVNVSLKASSVDMQLLSKLLSPEAISSAKTTKPNQASVARSSNRIFSAEPIVWGVIPNIQGEIKVDVQKLILNEQSIVGPVKFDANIKADTINIPNLSVAMGAGQFEGAFLAKNYRTTKPVILISGRGRGFSAQDLMALTGSPLKMVGGATDFGLNVTGGGKSIDDFVSTLNGQSQVIVGQGQLAPSKLNQSGDLLMSIFKVIDPRRNYSQTSLQCVVAYLPIRNGVINVQESIAIETDQLYLMMSGYINLDRENLTLDVKARDPSGITTGVSLASMVQIQGSLSNPQVGINKAGVARQGLNIGLGVLTAGVSILAENAMSMTDNVKPCQKATRSWAQVVGQ
jgi:uncharacterized protein involved in outer membrane biogenesis